MFYALFDERREVYELDDEGEKIVDFVKPDGTEVYRTTGTMQDYYKTPEPFRASISSQLNELHALSYGVDQSSVYSTKIWRENPIKWIDEEEGIPDQSSADYTVKGKLTEYLNFDWYLLQRNN